jgi:ATP phosphoribosyltransferase
MLLLQIPTYGIFDNVNSLSELATKKLWTKDRALRVVTGYTYVSIIFLNLKPDAHGKS